MNSYKNNLSAMGFTVERLIISQIASKGIRSDDFNIPPAKIEVFADGSTPLSNDQALGYYVQLQ